MSTGEEWIRLLADLFKCCSEHLFAMIEEDRKMFRASGIIEQVGQYFVD